ncbi:winged helix-turn-helix transcriptional regulator [Nonomuraea polychroma]|uniref:winged helix-turn-helix transcriptional regulator n=1 Tax=Nonomuraea polychroma TaxID=46176 RepID=UPI003D8C47C0
MQRTRFNEIACSIARAFDILGEPWTALILRDLFIGMKRFDDLQRRLGISRNVLAERLRRLVDEHIVQRRQYSHRPPRHEYELTDKGLELCRVLLVTLAWGDRWTAGPEGPPVLLRHRDCGELTHAVVTCAHCDQPLDAADVTVENGPGAQA